MNYEELKNIPTDGLIKMFESQRGQGTSLGIALEERNRQLIKMLIDSRSTATLERLTRWILFLTIIMTISTIVLLYKTFLIEVSRM
jgi:hypothetical protein